MFKRNRIKKISGEEFAERLLYCRDHRRVYYGPKGNTPFKGINAFLEVKEVTLSLTYRDAAGIPCTYTMRADDAPIAGACTGLEAYRILCRYYKVPDLRKHPKLSKWCGGAREGKISASPIQYTNPKYDHTRNRAYGYDINSAYSWAMLQPMPDTTVEPKYNSLIGPNEIGFKVVQDDDGGRSTVAVRQGYASVVYPLVESPFKRFVHTWYERKRLAPSGSDARNRAKSVLNYVVGYLQKVNPFYRTTIITYCNERIRSLIDDNTLSCNTDSIVSLQPRTDLSISDGIGDFKVEHDGYYAYIGTSYQWTGERAHIRGVNALALGGDFDLLTDKPKQVEYRWKYDAVTVSIIDTTKEAK